MDRPMGDGPASPPAYWGPRTGARESRSHTGVWCDWLYGAAPANGTRPRRTFGVSATEDEEADVSAMEWIGVGSGAVGASLGVYNFWQARWGSQPKYAADLTHQAGATYLLRATGRTDFVASLSHLLPLEPSTSAHFANEGSLIRVSRSVPTRLTLKAWGGIPPTALVLREVNKGVVVIADFPYSQEGWEAAQQKLP